MEQQLHAWFRYAIVFGIYLRRAPTAGSGLAHYEFGARNEQLGAKNKSSRIWHAPQRRLCSLYDLKRFYIKTLLLWIVVMHAAGLIYRRRIEGVMLTWAVGTTLFTAEAIANLLIISETLWQQKEHEEFLAQLQKVEFSLKLRLRLDIKQEDFARILRLYLCYLLSFFLAGLVLYLFTTIWLHYIGYFWYSFWFMIAMRIRLIQLVIYLRVLHYYMRCVSAKLRQIVAYHTAPNLQTLDVNYTQLKSHAYLLALQDTYTLLLEAFDLFNKFAGWSLLSLITCYILDISCNIYWSLLSLDGLVARKNFFIACVFWLCPMINLFWHICKLSEECAQLDQLIAHFVCQIIIPSTSSQLKTYRLALHQFSMQLKLCRVQVSAKCVFNLNMQLLMSVFTSIAAYLVIIIQFLNTSNR